MKETKVSVENATSFHKGRAHQRDNTMTDGQSLYLHGNEIAWKENGTLYLTLAGWNTVTTRERLNHVLAIFAKHYRFAQRNHRPVLRNLTTGAEREIDENEVIAM